jgi:trk system potassium uptake protein TrkH
MIQGRRFAGALGGAFWVTGLALLIPVAVAWWGDGGDAGPLPGASHAFLMPAGLAFLLWLPLRLWSRRGDPEDLQDREALLATAVGWLAGATLCGLPFLIAGGLSGPSAIFEGMAGLTGTGFTLLPADGIAPSLRFWRGILPLVGGLATVVLFAALLTRLSPGVAPATDLPGKQPHRLRPKLRETARTLTLFYGAIAGLFAAAFAILLWRQGDPWHVALRDSFSLAGATFGTGGIGAYPAGLAAHGPAVATVGYVACFLGATSLMLLFLLVRQGDRRLLRDPEWRFFVASLAAAVLLVGAILVRSGADLQDGATRAAALVLTTATGAGGLAGPLPEPAAASLLLLLIMLVGGTSGSAAGGIKAFRWMVAWKAALREVRRTAHPRAILPVRLGARSLPEETVMSVLGFLLLSLGVWAVGTILLVLLSPIRALDGAILAASALANVGAVGADALDPGSQAVLTVLMWAGRLELLVVLLALNPRSWRA